MTDQGISADYYLVPEKYEGGKVPYKVVQEEWLMQALNGVKTMYYQNIKDNETDSVQDAVKAIEIANAEEDESCQGGCKL